ncbi:hypothetical protein ACJJTC_009368 [Scirpophaga incertulas]
MCDQDRLPRKLCPECAQRLLNCSKFRHRTLRANSLMMEIIKKQDQLSLQSILSINRESNQLASNLSHKHFEVDHFDVHIDYNDAALTLNDPAELILDSNEIENEVKGEIKSEDNEIFVNEFDDIKPDDELSNTYMDDNNEVNDDNYAISDNNYSTDDSLPLEQRRSKKRSKSKKEQKKVRKKIKVDNAVPKIDRRRKPFLNDDLNETLFTITDLTVEEQIAEIDKRQESANYKNGVF